MQVASRLLPRTVTAQMLALVSLALLLTYALTVAVLVFFADSRSGRTPGGSSVFKIATIVSLAQATESKVQLASLLANARRAGIDVEQVAIADLVSSSDSTAGSRLVRRFMARVEDAHAINVLGADVASRNPTGNAIAVRLDGEQALVFGSLPELAVPRLFLAPATFTITVITVFVALLSVYVVRWITRPLSSIAAAADSFGRAPAGDQMLGETGPREIAQVARALNEMRGRIRSLVDNRTQMLVAIGHDLRTPLTRLRLRAERVGNEPLREGMLREIAAIDAMIDETLAYFRDDARSEVVSRVDLPSLLQTICTEFADVGYVISYRGPEHFAYCCRVSALARAITNAIENATKHASAVWVTLEILGDGAVEIEIADDGPGIPASMREAVFDPFFKGDAARTTSARTGFGLGLSIARDVVREHGGKIALLDRTPTGLRVRIWLPADGAGCSAGSANRHAASSVQPAADQAAV